MLILLRHGQTPNNAEARLQGDLDASIDEFGIEQARRAGDYIRRHWNVEAVVRTSLQRTTETAEHAGFGEFDAAVDDRWREISFGEYEGRLMAEVLRDLGDKWRADVGYVPPGGESLAQLHDRVVQACAEVIEQAAHKDILVISHATPIKAAAAWATGGQAATILNLWVHPGTVSIVRPTGGGPMLTQFNRGFE